MLPMNRPNGRFPISNFQLRPNWESAIEDRKSKIENRSWPQCASEISEVRPTHEPDLRELETLGLLTPHPGPLPVEGRGSSSWSQCASESWRCPLPMNRPNGRFPISNYFQFPIAAQLGIGN